MYASGPAQPSGLDGLRIIGAHRRRYEQSSVTAQDARLPTYVSDMVTPYGLRYDNAPLAANQGQSFSEMCQPLIEEFVTEPVDLLVLAFDLHDLRPGQATSIYLGHICPGDPLAFTVCDQGNAAPYTALRLIQSYVRTGAIRRALLLVAEQATLHYELLQPAPIPAGHFAAAFLLEPGPAVSVTVRPTHDVDAVSAEVSELISSRPDAQLIAGAGLGALGFGQPVTGQPLTGTWWQLAERVDEPRPLLLADYESRLGYLSYAWHEPILVGAA